MSNPNFVSDLVAMAKAFEELPKVQANLDLSVAEVNRLSDTVADREIAIARLKAEIEALQSDKRKLEAERDDAEFRFLESEDRVKSALDFLRSTFGSAGALIQALEPPAPAAPAVPTTPIPAPPAEPEVKHQWGSGFATPPTDAPQASPGQSEPDPISAQNTPTGSTVTTGGATNLSDAPSSDPMMVSSLSAEGTPAAQPDPTIAPTPDLPMSPTPEIATEVSSASTAVGTSTDRPYLNRRYVDVPQFIRLEEWLAGGGTEADYYWRPYHLRQS